jgi:asparagine synthase (glutamine-hydrolysing)
MCGIAGLLERQPTRATDVLEVTARAMADTLRHRGPDAGGVWVDAEAGIAFGHRRLSIQDLSTEGAQPMRSHCGRWVIVYNGEIYNVRELSRELTTLGHAFRGHSDTEVLLQAVVEWGIEATLTRLAGMFAFALWDCRERELHLVRDRVGKKPLYYGRCGDTFVFGSELKAIRAHPAFAAPIDRDALALFLRYSYIPAPHCIYEGFRKLEAGSHLTLCARRPEPAPPRAYWSARSVAEHGHLEPFSGTEDEAVDRLDGMLHQAVSGRMISDVELGALLSGGIDSSCVVAIMQAQSDRAVRTFSIGFDESGYDEAPYAAAVARHLGTDHTELIVRAKDCLELIPRLPELYDEPFGDVSQIPTYLVSELARRDVTVALSGDGGDELFAGYKRYFRALAQWHKWAGTPRPVRGLLAAAQRSLSNAAWAWFGDESRAASAWMRRAGKLDKKAPWLTATGPAELFSRMNDRCADPAALVPGASPLPTIYTDPQRWPRIDDPLQTMMFMDFTGYMAEEILVKVDRASMGVSLEVRAPLLDHRVVEFAWSLPSELRVDATGNGKRILRGVLERYVPRQLFERPKMGFGVPVAEWLRGPLREWGEALLSPSRLARDGYLDPDAIGRIWQQHQMGWRDHNILLWSVLMFQAWLDETRQVAV